MHSSDIPYEMRARAYGICRDYLHGAWTQINAKEMVIKHISGGLSNVLYYCALPTETSIKPTDPKEVLVRFYGQVHGEEAMESILAESVIFTLLSERALGPKLYGVFPGGRLEEYIPARSLTSHEMASPCLSRQIALRMAQMHSLNVPISKEPTWIWKSMDRWLKSSEEFLARSEPPSAVHSAESQSELLTSAACVRQKLRAFPFRKEMDFMKKLINKLQSPVVFAHNDMQEGNILLRLANDSSPAPPKISLIDFEYCSYNYRGFDLANHFCEWVYSYKLTKPPFFLTEKDAFPSKNQQLIFIRAYLAAYEASLGRTTQNQSQNQSLTNGVVRHSCIPAVNGHVRTGSTVFPTGSIDHNTGRNEPMEVNGAASGQSSTSTNDMGVPHHAEEVLLEEVKVFCLASHLFWSLWSIVQGHVSKIPFGYMDYALARMEHYYEDKDKLQLEEIFKRKREESTGLPE